MCIFNFFFGFLYRYQIQPAGIQNGIAKYSCSSIYTQKKLGNTWFHINCKAIND